MGNENSTPNNQRTSADQNPGFLPSPGEGVERKKTPEGTPGGPGCGETSSFGSGVNCSASEDVAGMDLNVQTPEVTEPRKCLQEAKSPSAPQEQENPSASMLLPESPPEAAPRDGAQSLLHPRRECSLSASEGALEVAVPEGDSMMATVPKSTRENEMKAQRQVPSSPSCANQLLGVSPTPPGATRKEQPCERGDKPGDPQFQETEATGDYFLEIKKGVAPLRAAFEVVNAAQMVKESSASGAEAPQNLQPPMQEYLATGTGMSLQLLPQELTADLGLLRGPHLHRSSSGAVAAPGESALQERGVYTELSPTSLSPTLMPGTLDSRKETADALRGWVAQETPEPERGDGEALSPQEHMAEVWNQGSWPRALGQMAKTSSSASAKGTGLLGPEVDARTSASQSIVRTAVCLVPSPGGKEKYQSPVAVQVLEASR